METTDRDRDRSETETETEAEAETETDKRAETMEWTQAFVAGTSPSARSRHTTTAADSRLFVLGGGDDQRVYNDLFVLDTGMCSLLLSMLPCSPLAYCGLVHALGSSCSLLTCLHCRRYKHLVPTRYQRRRTLGSLGPQCSLHQFSVCQRSLVLCTTNAVVQYADRLLPPESTSLAVMMGHECYKTCTFLILVRHRIRHHRVSVVVELDSACGCISH
jgi:hypothetical protein